MENECYNGYLHNYQLVKEYPTGLLERCEKCKDTQFFHQKIPNHIYLAFHQRQGLQKYDSRFQKEYGKN